MSEIKLQNLFKTIMTFMLWGIIIVASTTIVYGADIDKIKYVDSVGLIKGGIEVHGTEYTVGQNAKAWLQLLNSSGDYVNNGICYIDIYTPNNVMLIEHAQMNNMLHDGIYYYDLSTTGLLEGVYPVIARCYYTAIEVDYYPTNYTNIFGTPVTTVMSNALTIDGNFIRWNEDNNGVYRTLDFELQFNNMSSCTSVSEDLLTSLNINLYAKFDSVTSDDISIYIYNYTSSTWELLPNKLLEGASFNLASNVIDTNNITESGYYKNSTNGVRLRFNDTSLTDGADNNFDIDELYVGCNQLSNPQWIDVKGSSELHLTSENNYRFDVKTLCDVRSLTSKCSYFTQEVIFPEGIINENITITNTYGFPISQRFIYETPYAIDCTAIFDIYYTVNNVTTDLINDTIYSVGNKNNCILNIPIELAFGETSADIHIHMDNYMLWEVIRAYDIRQKFAEIEDICYGLGLENNFTFTLPLDTFAVNQTNNTDLIYCYRVLDDGWWFDYFYNLSLDVSTSGEYESYYYEIVQFYLPKLEDEYDKVSTVLRSDMQNNTLTILTELNMTTTNYTSRFDSIDNELTNIDNYLITIYDSISLLPYNIWNYVARYTHGVVYD